MDIIDIQELIDEEYTQINLLINDFQIPIEIMNECGASWMIISFESGYKILAKRRGLPAGSKIDDKVLSKCRADFERLYQSAPHIPRHAMESLSIAYGTLLALFGDKKYNKEYGSRQSQLKALMAIAMTRGSAMGHTGMVAGVMQTVNMNLMREKALSEYGAKGASVRLQPYAEFKRWTLENGAKLGSSKAVARTLRKQLPPHLADVSDDPERLIYETLRNRNKSS